MIFVNVCVQKGRVKLGWETAGGAGMGQQGTTLRPLAQATLPFPGRAAQGVLTLLPLPSVIPFQPGSALFWDQRSL